MVALYTYVRTRPSGPCAPRAALYSHSCTYYVLGATHFHLVTIAVPVVVPGSTGTDGLSLNTHGNDRMWSHTSPHALHGVAPTPNCHVGVATLVTGIRTQTCCTERIICVAECQLIQFLCHQYSCYRTKSLEEF